MNKCETHCTPNRCSQLFLVAVLLHPTKDQAENGELAQLIVPVQGVAALNEDDAKLATCELIPAEHKGKRGRLEVLVRQF